MEGYMGRIPACGIFCGGCPNYLRSRNRCPGASESGRCEKCTSYHGCCTERGISHCFECEIFPCKKLKGFAKRWEKYDQNMLINQRLLKDVGEAAFLKRWNEQATTKGEES